MEMLTIPQFFHKKDILVTGATGQWKGDKYK